MSETELKFQIPAGQLAAVRRAVATPAAETVRLQARYFDTPDRRLAQAGLALRLRREGVAWVQALKWPGDGIMQRGEHEVTLPAGQPPVLEPARHAGTPAGDALVRALGGDAHPLGEIFATDIRRTRRVLRAAGGVRVELALDEGRLQAGASHAPVCELEFELLQGPPAQLPVLANRWAQRHALWLDPRSKAQRGDRLARGDAAAAVGARQPPLHRTLSIAAAVRAMLAASLAQVLANACEVASGQGSVEHLHQCRVGLRRLRCVLRDFAPLALEVPQQADQQLRGLLQRLGRARDRDVLRATLLPRLAAAGAPWAELPAGEAAEDPGAVLREPAVTQLWLALLAQVHRMPIDDAMPSHPDLRKQVRGVLGKLHKQVARDAARFGELDEAAQHRTRKRLKRLRYGAELCSSLFPAERAAQWTPLVRRAQDALGEANDLAVARALFEPLAAAQPQAWFVLGWVAGQRPAVQAECAAALAALAAAPPFWARRGRR